MSFTPVIGKYRILATLGRGGMADVYLTVATGVGGFSKLVVVKELRPELAAEPEFCAMFLDEARLAARLLHPNVVQTNEVGNDDGRLFIAMEYLDGQPLSRLNSRFPAPNTFPLAGYCRMLSDVLSGLHYAHELRDFDGTPLQVVHRDATPHNVFLTYDGQVKLVDFGIAKALDSSTDTRTGVLKGKAGYMPPEQAMGEPVDRRADLYSVGIMLWEAAAATRMWKGLSDVAIIARLIKGEIPSVRDANPNVPEPVARIIDRATAPLREHRYANAEEMRADLDAYVASVGGPSLRELAAEVASRFSAERERIRSVIDSQTRELRRRPSDGGDGPTSSANLMATLRDAPSNRSIPEYAAIEASLTPTESGALSVPRRGSLGVPDLSFTPSGRTTTTSAAANSGPSATPPSTRWLWPAVVAGVGAAAVIGWVAARAGAGPAPIASVSARPLSSQPAVGASGGDPCKRTDKPLVELSGDIEDDDGVLSCENDYLLKFRAYVKAGITLTIQKGTVIKGDPDTKGTLIVQPGAKLIAVGTRDEPVVFTSAKPAADRRPGDWGGLIVLGRAPINLRDERGRRAQGRVEGIPTGGEYGGEDENDDSGVLKYVRIEYAGTKLGPGNEINGLTLAGVGRKTTLDFVQVRNVADDCFEFFGGTVGGKHLICSHPGDDAFDWDFGYRGRLQFLIVQEDQNHGGDSHGFEGDNDPNGSSADPVSAPTIFNATLCGSRRELPGHQFGMLLRRATQGTIRNSIITGYQYGVDVRDRGTRADIGSSIFFGNRLGNSEPEKGADDDDSGFDEQRMLAAPERRNLFIDPGLERCFNAESPRFGPPVAISTVAERPPTDGFFEPTATYVGAVRDGADDWANQPWVVWSAK